MNYPFNEQELIVTDHICDWPGYPSVPAFSYPVTAPEAYKMLYDRKPLWIPNIAEFFYFVPSVIPDSIARGAVTEAVPFDMHMAGGKDMFGVEWEFEESVGGSMVRRGFKLFDDANDWRRALTFPDVDSWDWDASARMNEQYLDNERANILRFLNGCWFERLISFMGFEDASMALIDEDQQDAVKDLFETITDLYCRIVDHCCDSYKLVGFNVHDDWGSQRAPFFSVNTGREMIVPFMKKLTDHIHSKGMIADLHSCGCVGPQIENFIAAGWDSWEPQPMNAIEDWYIRYGDQIILSLNPPAFDPETTTEEEQRRMARAFVDAHSDPRKPAKIGYYGTEVLTEAYCEELYRYSRELYGKLDY